MTQRGVPTAKWPTAPSASPSDTASAAAPAIAFDLATAEARLFVQRPDGPEVELEITQRELLIGRQATEVDLALDDELVSRHHARLSVDDRGYFTLEDLGSKNGIDFAGRSVRRLNLVDGDTFSIGRTTFRFHAQLPRFQHPLEPIPEEMASIMDSVSVPRPEVEVEASVGAKVDPKAAKLPNSGSR